jgi:uncharacterized iron-regulated protein
MRIFRLLLLLLSFTLVGINYSSAHTFDLNRLDVTTLDKMIVDLSGAQVVFIGETHDQVSHHAAQLQVIRELHEAGIPVSVGLEMFRQDGQVNLDRWVAGDMDEDSFKEVYVRHWGDWHLYRDIFIYARDNRIPLVGLNIPRQLVNQVARRGFDSLSAEQRKDLPLAYCNISPRYREFMTRTLQGHPLEGTAFEYFCEAQILWDASMALNLEEYLRENPQRTVVVLAGNGHAWKHGIPEQLLRSGEYRIRVLLPEIPGRVDRSTTSLDEADYLLEGIDLGPLH